MSNPLSALARRLVAPKKLEPSYPRLPMVKESAESNIPGIFLAGELAGTPLIKLGLNAGHDAVSRIASTLADEGDGGDPPAQDGELLDLVVVGAGSAGLAATVAAHDLGLSHVTLEASSFASTIVNMTRGKLLLAEPIAESNRTRIWFEECTREELLERWRSMVEEEALAIREHEKVTDIQGQKGSFTVTTDAGSYRARRVLLCLGKAGNPRQLGVPGERESAHRLHHRLLDPDDFHGQGILIVGAGDVACEAAIVLAGDPTNEVTLSAIDEEFTYPKQRNIDAVRKLEREGRLRILLASTAQRIEEDAGGARVTLRLADGSTEEIPAQSIFAMIGAELPFGFFKKVGIRLADTWSGGRWAVLALAFLFVYSLYALKSYGKGMVAWPYEHLISVETYRSAIGTIFDIAFSPFAWLFSEQALVDMRTKMDYQQGFLYSLIYTLAMAGFGSQALLRWRKKARNPRYQTWRFSTLIGFQVLFFIIVNIVAVKAMSVEYAWRAWGLYQPYPLFFNTFFWWYPGDPAHIKWFFIGAGMLGSLVAIPWAARNHGKRFCTWVCGCGGLAETLGDRWRHLSPKGERARAWEFQSAVVLAASIIVGAVVIGIYRTDGNNLWWKAYSYLVDFWLVAVIPITLYPFFGGKIWCRYWCPLAAFNQLLSRWFGRLKIVSNDQCITCTECSKYCQVGVDVMAFAMNQQPFDNSNSACIHCGICIDVCPMGVLSFETSDGRAATPIPATLKRSSGATATGSTITSTVTTTTTGSSAAGGFAGGEV
ncbi:MAG: NAD(P)-binding domain-containing protein [Planctomycetota bacterium]